MRQIKKSSKERKSEQYCYRNIKKSQKYLEAIIKPPKLFYIRRTLIFAVTLFMLIIISTDLLLHIFFLTTVCLKTVYDCMYGKASFL